MPKKIRMKPMLPTLRECKRYIAFEVISPKRIGDFKMVLKQIEDSAQNLLGVSGMSKAGLIVIDKWDEDNQRGLVRVNDKYVNYLKASLSLIKEINNQPTIVRSVGVSGILKKAKKRYLAS